MKRLFLILLGALLAGGLFGCVGPGYYDGSYRYYDGAPYGPYPGYLYGAYPYGGHPTFYGPPHRFYDPFYPRVIIRHHDHGHRSKLIGRPHAKDRPHRHPPVFRDRSGWQRDGDRQDRRAVQRGTGHPWQRSLSSGENRRTDPRWSGRRDREAVSDRPFQRSRGREGFSGRDRIECTGPRC